MYVCMMVVVMFYCRAEKLQLLNLRPLLRVDIQVMVEEIEERFDEREISDILKIINDLVPSGDLNNSAMES